MIEEKIREALKMEMQKPKQKRIRLAQIDLEQVADEIGNFIVERVLKFGKTGGIIGLSGGVDSTTTATLAKRAFDKYNAKNPDKPLELVGYMLPSNTNNPEDTKDGIKVAEKLGIRYEVKSLEPIVKAYSATNPEALEVNYHKGNLTCEIRATVLRTKAASENKSAIGTGNKDEDFGIGYYTLFGDGAMHMSPIGNLPKRLVRQMAAYLGFKDLANRTPTAGLEPGQTDFKDLGYDYDVVELVTEGLRQSFTVEELTEYYQLVPLVKEQIKKYESLFGRKKFSNVEDVVYDIIKRNKTAKEKTELIHPPIAPITLRYE